MRPHSPHLYTSQIYAQPPFAAKLSPVCGLTYFHAVGGESARASAIALADPKRLSEHLGRPVLLITRQAPAEEEAA